MQRSTILALAALATLAAAGAQAAQKSSKAEPYYRPQSMPQARTAGEASAARGHLVYTSAGCWQCHGTTGASGGPGGRLAPNPLPYQAIHNQLRSPRARMPVYPASLLSDADIQDIEAYLKSAAPAKSASDIPMLSSLYEYK